MLLHDASADEKELLPLGRTLARGLGIEAGGAAPVVAALRAPLESDETSVGHSWFSGTCKNPTERARCEQLGAAADGVIGCARAPRAPRARSRARRRARAAERAPADASA